MNMETYKNEIKAAQNYIEHFKFDKQHPWHRNLIALYLSLIEYSDALINLIENEKSIAVPVVFRSLLEAYVDFKNLSEDKAYGYNMEANYAYNWLKSLEEASKNKNEYWALTASEPNLNAAIQEQKDKLAELKAKGYQPLSVFDKFKRAGMIEENKSVYKYLCSHSHNNINSFTERFFVFNDAKNDFEITLFKEQEDDEFDSYLSTGCAYLRNGSHNIHAVLETGYENKFPV
jgi:hypothetical protein